MNTDWIHRPLGDVCKVVGGGTPSKREPDLYKGVIPWATVRDMRHEILSKTQFSITHEAVKSSATNIIPGGNVVIATRVGLGKACLLQQDTAINQDLRGVIPKSDNLDVLYLFRWFQSIADDIEAEGTGATVKGVKLTFIKGLSLPIPSLSEQKRIVSILDEAFDGIEAAIANTEKNLANARELFESYLNVILDKCDQEHPKKRLSDICQFRSGGTPSKKKAEYWDGNIPWVSGRDMKTAYMYDSQLHISESAISESVTRLAPAGALLVLVRGMGLAHGAQVTELMVPCAFNQDIKAILPKPNVVSSYLLFSLKHKINVSENTLSAAAHGTLKINSEELKNLLIPLPPLGVQKETVSKFIDISESTKRLVAVSKLKISALLELKKSLLRKAFTGELTANNVVEITTQTQPKAPIETNSPEFAAHIMAAAYHWHASEHRGKTFGRVKAQKTLHLMESLADIELGRQPIKDAAGPNDFQHMQRAEEWARDRGFFEFVKRSTGQRGYDFRKGERYGGLVAEAMQALVPYENVLKRVVKVLMPLNTAETEILATAYAAWNNLLLEGVEPTEIAIIHEARENWHADKLKYSEEQFRNAISQLRQNGLVPQGRGKRVTGQESLAL